jgi:autotransporter translocation and assembly factor TamB
VVYTDTPPRERRAPSVSPSSDTSVEVEIDAHTPFWVRRSDLAVQLAAALRFERDARGQRLSGSVKVQRGQFTVLGKGFALRRGSILFDESDSIDPTLDIEAVHQLGSGSIVTMSLRGPMSAPILAFTSNVEGATSNADALQLLLRGRAGDESASDELGAALAALTAGFVDRLATSAGGRYVPVLSLESDSAYGTRVRAGVDANNLVPARLRPAVSGMYVEGFVGARREGGTREGTAGVLVELYHPHQLVTAGSWEPGCWSIEATWEP